MADKKGKNGKTAKAIIAVLVIIVIALAGVIFYMNYPHGDAPEDASTTQSTTLDSTKASEKEKSTDKSQAQTTEEQTTATTKQPTGYSLPLTVNEALDALSEHYGSDFDINSTIEENGLNYFAIYKDDVKYASVTVDLITGKATEKIISTGEKTQFSLV